jgi:hypothetical protein
MNDEVKAPASAGAKAAVRPRTAAVRKGRKAKPKQIRWSGKRERAFLQTLAATAQVTTAVRASGLSESTIRRHRASDESFAARWAAALAEGVDRLETLMLDRALNGVEKPIWYGGKQVGTMTEYSDRTALAVLAHHRGTVRDASPPTRELSADEWRTHWDTRFKGMQRRIRGGD